MRTVQVLGSRISLNWICHALPLSSKFTLHCPGGDTGSQPHHHFPFARWRDINTSAAGAGGTLGGEGFASWFRCAFFTCSFGTWPVGRQQHPSPARVDGTPKGGSQHVLQTPQQAPEGVWQLLCQFPGKFCDTFSSSSAEVLPSGGSSGTEALASTPLRPITPPGGLPVEFCGYPKGLLVSCLPDSACGTWAASPCSGPESQTELGEALSIPKLISYNPGSSLHPLATNLLVLVNNS